jgi:hypothetical protein
MPTTCPGSIANDTSRSTGAFASYPKVTRSKLTAPRTRPGSAAPARSLIISSAKRIFWMRSNATVVWAMVLVMPARSVTGLKNFLR